MAAITTAIAAAIGAGSLGAGLFEKSQGDAKTREGLYQQQLGYGVEQIAAAQQAQIGLQQSQASVGFAQQNQQINITAAQQAASAANQSAAINKQIIADNQAVEQQRQAAMELDAHRQQIEILRTQQQARSQALTAATAQGGKFGSGLQGGYGQISGQTSFNLLGVSQNLAIGENIYGLNADITQKNIQNQNLQDTYAQQQAQNRTDLSNLQYSYAQSNADFQTRSINAGLTMSQGQGMVAAGGGTVAAGQMQSSFGSTLINAAPQIFSAGATLNNMMPTLSNWFTPGGGVTGTPFTPDPVTGLFGGPH